MAIKLIVVGKTSTPYLVEGEKEYLKRLGKYTRLTYIELPNFKQATKWTPEQLKKAGYSDSDIAQAGFKENELDKAGIKPYSPQNQKTTGVCSIDNLKKERAKGVLAKSFRDKGCSAEALRKAGYTAGELDNNTSDGGDDLILIKYDSSGTRQWTQQYGSSGSDYARGISLDSSGNIYVVGDTSGGLGSNSNSGSEDLFLIKYNSSGNLQWTQQLGTFSNDVAFDVATDSSGNSYVTGYTGSSLDNNTHSGELDLFLVKYDSNGNKSWTKQLGTSTSDYARGVSVDADGNVSFTGYTTAALDGQTHYGSDDLFLVKYNSSGTKLWTRQLGTSTLDRAVDVIHDASGNAYIAGSTLGDLDYQRSKGGDDLFLVKYNSDGVKQ